MVPSTSSTSASDAYAVEWGADRAAIDRALGALCDRYATTLGSPVDDAVRYSLLGGGKRLRGVLVLAAYRAASGDVDSVRASGLAAAVEIVHAYSLVHDDLPCMDDDDVRRGRPTVHRAFGVAVATAAGVAMVPLAVRAALDGAFTLGLPSPMAARIVSDLMRASGAGGMIGGQLMDLEGEGRPLGVRDLEHIHRAKTGTLIRASVVLGGIAANASDGIISALERFGDAVGLAFQIADDVLGVTATTATLGKPAGRDVDLRKGTYPAILGVAGAKQRAAALVTDACGALRDTPLNAAELQALARFVVERRW